MKTQMLELTIFKIGTLLQRGFGELGAGIVAESLIQTDPGMDLNAPGKRTELVFSICRIRQFTETTECLQDEIIVFVNKIVKIIHECTKKWDGKPTKNYGDKYLLTWRIPTFSDAVDYIKGEDGDFASSSGPTKSPIKSRHTKENSSSGMLDKSINNEKSKLLKNGQNSTNNLIAEPVKQEEIDYTYLFQQMTQSEMHDYRQETADRALIAAVKTIAEIGRAQDL